MPGVTLEEAASCTNPLLQFVYQREGVLTDVATLTFRVRDVVAAADRVAETAVNLADCPVGARLGPGRYAATFSALAGSGFVQGTHEIIWKYQPEVGDPFIFYRQRFEVLLAAEYPTGRGYRSYVDASTLLANSAFSGFTLTAIQSEAQLVAEEIEILTGRFFDPRYIDARYNGTLAGALPLSHPIIGIDGVSLVSAGAADTLLSFDLDSFVFYNRHVVSGLLDPDDRTNPRIEFSTDLAPGSSVIQGSFDPGRQNVRVSGVFGYTEFDGGPVGRRPRRLERVASIMLLRKLQDPYGVDPFTSQPGRIRGARTRDQAITFGGSSDGSVGELTGDRVVDDVLMTFRRPPYYGAVSSEAVIHNDSGVTE